ncbi:MAG: ATP-binding protein [Deltaproteobacteria bacterium]|nr:ATP-binding protein [Deltaproteobacteria bacterium]
MILKIEHKITMIVVGAILLIATIGFVAYRNCTKINKELRFVEIADDLTNTVLEIRRAEKNYFLYHDKQSIPGILVYAQKIETSVDGIKDEIVRTVGKSELEKFMDNLYSYKSCIKDLINHNPPSKVCVMAIREKGRELYEFTKDLSQKERQNISGYIRFLKKILFCSLGFILVLGIIGGHFMAKSIVRPLKRIEEGTKKISQGDFTPIPELKTHDEIQSLCKAFNRMIRELKIRETQLVQSKKLASLGTLLAGVAHELNNPLSNISTSCQILLEEIENPDLNFRKQLLEQIEEQTNKARNIIYSLLEFSRQKEFEKETLNLRDIIHETIGFIRGEMPTKVEMVVDVPDNVNIYADKQRIEQAFLNIITNAIQAIPNEGIVSVKARVDEERGFVNIEFEDSGVGIKPEILPRIFDPFFTTKEVGEGAGLGLFITHEIIERHGGSIKVESEVGKGTIFLVQLPLKEKNNYGG